MFLLSSPSCLFFFDPTGFSSKFQCCLRHLIRVLRLRSSVSLLPLWLLSGERFCSFVIFLFSHTFKCFVTAACLPSFSQVWGQGWPLQNFFRLPLCSMTQNISTFPFVLSSARLKKASPIRTSSLEITAIQSVVLHFQHFEVRKVISSRSMSGSAL